MDKNIAILYLESFIILLTLLKLLNTLRWCHIHHKSLSGCTRTNTGIEGDIMIERYNEGDVEQYATGRVLLSLKFFKSSEIYSCYLMRVNLLFKVKEGWY